MKWTPVLKYSWDQENQTFVHPALGTFWISDVFGIQIITVQQILFGRQALRPSWLYKNDKIARFQFLSMNLFFVTSFRRLLASSDFVKQICAASAILNDAGVKHFLRRRTRKTKILGDDRGNQLIFRVEIDRVRNSAPNFGELGCRLENRRRVEL